MYTYSFYTENKTEYIVNASGARGGLDNGFSFRSFSLTMRRISWHDKGGCEENSINIESGTASSQQYLQVCMITGIHAGYKCERLICSKKKSKEKKRI